MSRAARRAADPRAFISRTADEVPARQEPARPEPANRARVYVAPAPAPEARPMTRRAIREAAAAAAEASRRTPRLESIPRTPGASEAGPVPVLRRARTADGAQPAHPQVAQARPKSFPPASRRPEVAAASTLLAAESGDDTTRAALPTVAAEPVSRPPSFAPPQQAPASAAVVSITTAEPQTTLVPRLSEPLTVSEDPEDRDTRPTPAVKRAATVPPAFDAPTAAEAPPTAARLAPATPQGFATPASPFAPVHAPVAPASPAPAEEHAPIDAAPVEVAPEEQAIPQAEERVAAVIPIETGRRATPPISARRTAQAAARRGGKVLPRVASSPRMRRTVAGTAAAVALVALTTTAVAATMDRPADQSAKSNMKEGAANVAGASSGSAKAATATARTQVPQATLTAASDELVRADFVTQNASSTIDAKTLQRIKEVRGELNTAVAASTPSPLDGRNTDRASRSGGTARTAPSSDAAAAEEAAPTTGATASDQKAAGTQDATAAGASANGAVESAEAKASAAAQAKIEKLTSELRALVDSTSGGVSIDSSYDPNVPDDTSLSIEQLDKWAASTEGYTNGRLPSSVLCELSFAPGAQLRCDAAHQLESLNAAFAKKFGHSLTISDSYRSYAEQVAVKRAKGRLAGTPGTSNHGWGVAVDIAQLHSYSSAEYKWMRQNAPRYGWDNPSWARPGGSKTEPWHWQYLEED